MIDQEFDDLSFLASRGCYELMNPKDLIWLQYTGLKDKNGVEIYEGDIVKCSSGCPHEIYWSEPRELDLNTGFGMPRWYLKGLKDGYSWSGLEEIIGNIYENPELLENK